MYERPSINNTPKIIDQWLKSPYYFFGEKFKSKNVLDIGCGENNQLNILKNYFKNIRSIDKEKINNTVEKIDVFKIKDIYDTVFCFEVIEHLSENIHEKFIKHLFSITKKDLVLGSVNISGPKKLNNIEIYTGEKNPFHIKEYTSKQWKDFFKKFNFDITFYFNILENNRFKFKKGLSNLGISNYIHIKKKG
jgi:2-polyprenyl-3-methyl-5-hydroxy-6-metoxy-1,4-benzoquinol methylase